jgi:hypothetical protein
MLKGECGDRGAAALNDNGQARARQESSAGANRRRPYGGVTEQKYPRGSMLTGENSGLI